MVYIKLLLIILLCVVYYNEATYQIDIDKSDCEKYYNTVKENITDLFNGSKLYHTQISCYLCIFAEINLQLDLIEILSNANNKIETVNKFKSDMELFKSRFGNWKNLCDKGMPTDTRKSFFAIYTTRYKTSLQQNNPIDVEKCMMSSFTRVKLSITDFDKIKHPYEDDRLSYTIFRNHIGANGLNLNCLDCIDNFVKYELERWNKIEPTVRSAMTPGNIITEGEHWETMKDIFINYQRYIDAVKTWITRKK
ncbi:uncharacterized protein LOC142333630 isoform X2 [Lycorma delicatula]|uniref:uncharacterized protein LOC142333630 isoform X2 n=1 Tax=Lycorma delicatula TaxID=130591 RepID=UPI003F5180CB